jgi:pyrimidine operon attenuation protein/uracil phosphoribosyltransferase
MEILNEQQIHQKIDRLAFEVLENNYEERQVLLIGINNTGMKFAKMLQLKLQSISEIDFPLAHLELNEASVSQAKPPSQDHLRPDVVEKDLTHEEALKNAPRKNGRFFEVPSVMKNNQ